MLASEYLNISLFFDNEFIDKFFSNIKWDPFGKGSYTFNTVGQSTPALMCNCA